jgi:hypothetical protein
MQIHNISLTCVLKTKDRLDDPIVLCMIGRLIVFSAYHYSPFAFGLSLAEYTNIPFLPLVSALYALLKTQTRLSESRDEFGTRLRAARAY